jgi:acid phosphatase
MRQRLGILFSILLLTPALGFSTDKLIFAVDLIRHGDRTPIIGLPSVDYQWQQGYGQLTAEGMRQEYELGKTFRKRYIEDSHLLTPSYQQDSIYVRSTDYERTLMSAQSLLMGLYPAGTGPKTDNGNPGLPDSFQPIPIHTAPAEFDRIIIHKVDPQEEKRLMQKYVYSTKEWKTKDAALRSKYSLWSELTGLPIDALQDLERIGDALYIHQVHHVPMPDGLSADDIQTIIEAANYAFMAEEKPKPIAAAYSRQMMTNIADYIQKGSRESSKLKYVLLSAHDSTIARALSYMGAPLAKAPPYASNLNFSLYKNDSQNYIVKVTYNGVPVSIPACGGNICQLKPFLDMLRDEKINLH